MFRNLQKILKKYNNISNLTRLIDSDEYWISQVYDSIWPFLISYKKIFDQKNYIDIGSGCGFPGFAYAITHPNSKVHLIDSSSKKTDALKNIVIEMNLTKQVTVIKDRIENLAHDTNYRNNFDIATIRAVGSPSTVSEYLLPMLNKSGLGILYCGKWLKQDTQNIERALKILKGTIKEINRIILPKSKGERNVIFIEPYQKCPNSYPRAIGKPRKYPL
tara:strand:- start:216 stop:869 length:654 start_codon:yes stop_codon:yes gene_type:complete